MAKYTLLLLAMVVGVSVADLMRKSIVFDKATPGVFYCPLEKPTSFDKMLVRSRPLHKLCEFNGRGLPADYKSDCYNDVDESQHACKEKQRILKRRTEEAELQALAEGSRIETHFTEAAKVVDVKKQ